MKIGRRELFRRGAGAAVAAPLIAGSLRQQAVSAMMPGSGWAPPPETFAFGGSPVMTNPVLDLAYRTWWPSVRAAERRAERSYQCRQWGIEPVIAGLRSVSPAHKIIMQGRADDARQSAIAKLRRHIWPDEDHRW